MNKRETIYLSGPMKGMPQKNYKLFYKAQLYYETQGYKVINPHRLGEILNKRHLKLGIQPPNYMQYLAYDIHIMMTNANKISLLTGWQDSFGVKMEIVNAIAKPGMKFIEYDSGRYISFKDVIIEFNYDHQYINRINHEEKVISIF